MQPRPPRAQKERSRSSLAARALSAAGDAWGRLGRLEQARDAYLKAEKRSTPNVQMLALLAQRDLQEAARSLSRHDFARAERMYRRVIAFAPGQPEASAGIATCLLKLGEPQQAEAWSKRAQLLSVPRPTP